MHDAQCQSFHNRRFSYSGFANQHRVVLRPAGKYLNYPANLLIPADHRIELSLLRSIDEVNPVTLQRLVLVLGMLVCDARAAAQFLECRQNILIADTTELQDVLSRATDFHQRQQQVFGGNEFILHRLRFALGGCQHLGQILAHFGCRAATDAGIMLQFGFEHFLELPAVDTNLLQDRHDNPLRLAQHGREKMKRVDFRVAVFLRE